MANDEAEERGRLETGINPNYPNWIDEFIDATRHYRAHYIWLVRRITGCTDEAEDIVQLALMRAFANLHRFRGEARISTWLKTIVQNAAIEHVRNHKGRVFLSLDSDGDQDRQRFAIELHDSRSTPEEFFLRQELDRILGREVSRLTSNSRRAIQMCILDGFSQAEAALTLDVTVGTIKSRILRGKRQLYNALHAQSGANRNCGSMSTRFRGINAHE